MIILQLLVIFLPHLLCEWKYCYQRKLINVAAQDGAFYRLHWFPGLKDGLKQLYFEKEQNISQAANLKDQINLLKQHEQSLSCGLTK